MKLKKLFTIPSMGKRYKMFFPVALRVDDDGNLYVIDGAPHGLGSASKILKFDYRGQFVKSLLKKGQGPGEVIGISDISFAHNELFVYDYLQRKVIVINKKGNFIREFRINSPLWLSFLGFYNNQFIFIGKTPSYYIARKTDYYKEENYIYRLVKGKLIKGNVFFPTSTYIVVDGPSRSFAPMEKLLAVVWNDKFIYVNHTSSYLIRVYDLIRDKIIFSFRRKYIRVKNRKKEEDWFVLQGKRYYIPQKKWRDDIQKLLVHDGKLWVFTSTFQPFKGVLVDVFSMKGKYENCFFLRFSHKIKYDELTYTPMIIYKDFMYVLETTDKDTFVIVKYAIPELDGL